MKKDKSQVIDMIKNKEGVYVVNEGTTREEFFERVYQEDRFKKKKTFMEEAIGEGILGGLYRFFSQDILSGENKFSDVSEADKRRYG
ncbi:MAG: hypothetical protein WC511_00690 [Candidatus Pacearchaeota archaeon]|jgi:hypothetical protein